MRILLLDNYDSFIHNIRHAVGMVSANIDLYKNDAVSVEALYKKKYTHIIIGPGPGSPLNPDDVGISEALIAFAVEKNIPLLGICMGHQILGKYFGAQILPAKEVRHGKLSQVQLPISKKSSALFKNVQKKFNVMRYHSLCITNIPDSLTITALADDGTIMAIEHQSLPLYGVQFHPESFTMNIEGPKIIQNFLSIQPKIST